jgi:hypothetical protein
VLWLKQDRICNRPGLVKLLASGKTSEKRNQKTNNYDSVHVGTVKRLNSCFSGFSPLLMHLWFCFGPGAYGYTKDGWSKSGQSTIDFNIWTIWESCALSLPMSIHAGKAIIRFLPSRWPLTDRWTCATDPNGMGFSEHKTPFSKSLLQYNDISMHDNCEGWKSIKPTLSHDRPPFHLANCLPNTFLHLVAFLWYFFGCVLLSVQGFGYHKSNMITQYRLS